jgi:hypothetical protein
MIIGSTSSPAATAGMLSAPTALTAATAEMRTERMRMCVESSGYPGSEGRLAADANGAPDPGVPTKVVGGEPKRRWPADNPQATTLIKIGQAGFSRFPDKGDYSPLSPRSTSAYSRSLVSLCEASTTRVVPDFDRITIDCVVHRSAR